MASKSGYYNGKHHADLNKFLKAQERAQKAAKELKDYTKKLQAKYGQNFKMKDLPKAQASKLDRLMGKARDLALDTLKY